MLKETIESVINQTYIDWEIIIVDDGSDEKELVAVKKFETEVNIKVIKRNQGKKGPSACRNIGIESARGEFIIFLDSDDLLASFCLEQRIVVMKENPEVNIAVFLIENFQKTVGDMKTIFNKVAPTKELSPLFLKNENPWQTMGPIWKKHFLLHVGGFDEDLLFMEDPELHLRAINSPDVNIKICYDKPADCYYRINNMDVTKKEFYFNSIFYRILFYKKILHGIYSNDFIEKNSQQIKMGIYSLVKTFLYYRKNEYPQLYYDFKKMIYESKLFSDFEAKKLFLLIELGNRKNFLAVKFKLKGLCYKLLASI